MPRLPLFLCLALPGACASTPAPMNASGYAVWTAGVRPWRAGFDGP